MGSAVAMLSNRHAHAGTTRAAAGQHNKSRRTAAMATEDPTAMPHTSAVAKTDAAVVAGSAVG